MDLANIKRDGFGKLSPDFLTQEEAKELAILSQEAFDSMKGGHPDLIPIVVGGEGVMRIPQQHPRIAEILNNLFSEPNLKNILESFLGTDYKVWQINYRRSTPADKGLFLHQDANGELGLSILLSDNETGSGATTFLKGSHLVAKRMVDIPVIVPPHLLMILKSMFTPLTGKMGEIGLFFNRTWHGRFSNKATNCNDIILISFFPAHYATIGYEGYGNWSQEFLDKIKGTELSRLIDPSIGTVQQANGRYLIMSSQKNPPKPYVINLEEFQNDDHLKNVKLRVSIAILKVIMSVGKPATRVYRKLIGY